MKRLSSQLIFCSPNDIRRNSMLELDNQNMVTQIQDLSTLQTETAQTIFYNGIISPSIISLEKRITSEQIVQVREKYNYINLLADFMTPDLFLDKRTLVLDAATENPLAFSLVLQTNYKKLKHLSIYEIINATTFKPASILGMNNEIKIHSKTIPLLWQNCNLIEKLITAKTVLIHI